MKPAPTYSVIFTGHRIVDEFRGDRILGDTYTIIKTPQFGNPSAYEVILSTIGSWCNCPGHSHHGKCKHLQMVYDHIATIEPTYGSPK